MLTFGRPPQLANQPTLHITYQAECPNCQHPCQWTQHMGENSQPHCRCEPHAN